MTAPQVTRTFKVTPLPRWFSPKWRFASGSSPGHLPGDGCLLQIMALCAPDNTSYFAALQQPTRMAISHAPTCARLFHWKETGASNTAAALIAFGFVATSPVTIGVTNVDVISNSAVDDGAADHGVDCT